MTAAANLTINIVANTKQLSSGMKSASGNVKSFLGDVGKGLGSLSLFQVGAAGAIALGINKMGEAVKSGLSEIDTLAKLSDRLGVATEDYQALAFHADLAGVSQEEMSSGIEKMLTAVGKGDSALTDLGLSIEKLKDMNAVDMFAEIGEAINRLPTAADKMAAVRSIFGKSGSGFLNVFEGGRAGIRRSVNDFNALGGGVSRSQAREVEEANDAMTRLGYAFDSLRNQLVVALAPALEEFVNMMVHAVQGYRGAQDNLTDFFAWTMGVPLDYAPSHGGGGAKAGRGRGVRGRGVGDTAAEDAVRRGHTLALRGSQDEYDILRSMRSVSGDNDPRRQMVDAQRQTNRELSIIRRKIADTDVGGID